MISFDDFLKGEIRVGQILSAEKIPDTDKLLTLTVDFGVRTESVRNEAKVKTELLEVNDIRTVVSGIALAFLDPAALIGKKFAFVTNLPPRNIKGIFSEAMILAAGEGKSLSLFTPTHDVPAGSALR